MLRRRASGRPAARRGGRFPLRALLLIAVALAAVANIAAYAGPPLQSSPWRVYLPLLADGRTPQPTPSATSTATRTATPTGTATGTATRTATPTGTATGTATRTATTTATGTTTSTTTGTATATSTTTSTATATSTTTSTATATSTSTSTATSTATATGTTTPQPEIIWTAEGPNYPGAYTESQALVLNGKIYTFGGFGGGNTPTDRSYVFDPQSSTWKAIARLPFIAGNGETGGGVTHAGIATDGTYIYLASGYIAASPGSGQVFGTKQVWRYDPAANTYARLPNLPVDRAAGQLAVVGRELHYFGGTNKARTVDTPEHWSLNLDGGTAWVQRASMLNGRHHLGAVTYGGKIYVVGGQHAHDGALVPQKQTDVYDPATDTWTQLADMPEGRNHIISSTVLRGDQIIIVAGQARSGQRRNTVFVYDISENRWLLSTPLPVARHSAIAGIIRDKIYFTGGSVISPDLSPKMYVGTITSSFGQGAP